ncbi:hypothetical protein SCHPADRAFT_943465 [Schizopora paradoxa]|uniref:BTB domain-containing protein n=1 Tax=Schizopora paradoxa TaxID=27342 RepID=A0A0H2RJM4_9AGAM|nr:hypothetical protein SCHPADRAFT_943465 [Schizopora paradoxa]
MDNQPQKHDLLWFPDGNVVLATDTLLFRVHKGVLSFHSTVLRDMFDIVQDPTTRGRDGEGTSSSMEIEDGADVYEGLPLVMLSGDKGEDVVLLLRAIYERCAKYDVVTVRKDIIGQLSRNFPSSLDSFESISTRNSTLFGIPREESFFPILRACVSSPQADIEPILPVLFFACSTFPIAHIVKELPITPTPAMEVLLIGKRMLDNTIVLSLFNTLDGTSPHSGCPYNSSTEVCDTARHTPMTRKMKMLIASPMLENLKGDDVVKSFFEKRCKECREEISAKLETGRVKIWNKVPKIFGFQ